MNVIGRADGGQAQGHGARQRQRQQIARHVAQRHVRISEEAARPGNVECPKILQRLTGSCGARSDEIHANILGHGRGSPQISIVTARGVVPRVVEPLGIHNRTNVIIDHAAAGEPRSRKIGGGNEVHRIRRPIIAGGGQARVLKIGQVSAGLACVGGRNRIVDILAARVVIVLNFDELCRGLDEGVEVEIVGGSAPRLVGDDHSALIIGIGHQAAVGEGAVRRGAGSHQAGADVHAIQYQRRSRGRDIICARRVGDQVQARGGSVERRAQRRRRVDDGGRQVVNRPGRIDGPQFVGDEIYVERAALSRRWAGDADVGRSIAEIRLACAGTRRQMDDFWHNAAIKKDIYQVGAQDRRIPFDHDLEFMPLGRVEGQQVGACALAEIDVVVDRVAGQLIHRQPSETRHRRRAAVVVVRLCQREGNRRAADVSRVAVMDHEIAFAAVKRHITVAAGRIRLRPRRAQRSAGRVERVNAIGAFGRRRNARAEAHGKSVRQLGLGGRIQDIHLAAHHQFAVAGLVAEPGLARIAGVLHSGEGYRATMHRIRFREDAPTARRIRRPESCIRRERRAEAVATHWSDPPPVKCHVPSNDTPQVQPAAEPAAGLVVLSTLQSNWYVQPPTGSLHAMAALAWRTARQPAVRHKEVMSLKRIETFWLWLCEWKARPFTVRDLLNGFQD